MKLLVLTAVAACWTGPEPVPPSPLRVSATHFTAPPPVAAITSEAIDRNSFALGDATRGCTLMIAKGCARCHYHGANPRAYSQRKLHGVDGMRRNLAMHSAWSKGTLTADETEDLVTCMYERWF